MRLGRVKSTNFILKKRKHTQRQSDLPKGKEGMTLEPKLELMFSDFQILHTFSLVPFKRIIKTHYLNHSVPPSICSTYFEQRIIHWGDPGDFVAFAVLKLFFFFLKCVCVNTWQLLLWVSNEVRSVLTLVYSVLQQHSHELE